MSRGWSLRRRARSPLVFWAAVAALALVTGSVVSGSVGRAHSLADRYGPLQPLVVAARPVERGVTLARADLDVRSVPASLRPPAALISLDQAVGRVAVVPLLPGEPVLPGHLAPDGLSPVAAQLPPGRRAVSVPTGSASPALRRGDTVDLLATLDGSGTLAVALDAAVVDVGPEAATVALTPEEARAVAFALSQGALTVAVTPGVAPQGPSNTSQRAPVASSSSTAAPARSR